MVDSVALRLGVLLPIAEILAEPSEGDGDYVGGAAGAWSAPGGQLGVCRFLQNGSGGHCGGFRYFLVGSADWADDVHCLRRLPRHLDWLLRRSPHRCLGFC